MSAAPIKLDDGERVPEKRIKTGEGDFQGEFEKNYPKNIFIPLIEYLSELGYKQVCQESVGKKADFEGKNVVPLSSIYQLITQGWFCRNISKELALSHISNKILLNSKIKKKLFHLLVAQLIFTASFQDSKDFRRRVSKEANFISRRTFPEDPLFSYPNAIIYLLHIFRRILMNYSKKNFTKIEQDFQKMTFQDAPQQSKSKGLGSKEEYKFYVKEIVHLFSSKAVGSQFYSEVLEEVRQQILEKDKLIREKYKLIEGIPNWVHFIDNVVMRCFQHKKKDGKITNFLFNEWINDCKGKMLSILEHKCKAEICPQMEEEGSWKGLSVTENWSALPMPLIGQIEGTSGKEDKQPSVVKKFVPIILSPATGHDPSFF